MRLKGTRRQTYLFDLQNITRHYHRSFNLGKTAIAEYDSLESKCFLQFIHNRPSLEFLNEADGSVE